MARSRRAPRHARYADAIAWIADNDDNEWLEAPEKIDVIPSVTASLVADLFGRTDDEVQRDLRKALARRTDR